MLKNANVAVFDLVKDVVDGKVLEPGSVHTANVKTGGVELLLCPDVADKIPADVKAKLEELKADIASGKIKVATTTQ
jgi:basic membrane protein A